MNRNAALDMFRGLLLVIMTLDHLPGAVRAYSFESLGFASAAEGFVFLSGFVAAMVYGREADAGRRSSAIRARVGKIYKYHLLLLSCVLLLYFLLPGYTGSWSAWLTPYDRYPDESLLLAFPLLYQPRFLDILPLYCVLMAGLPWALTQLRQGRQYRLLLGSLGLWLLGQYFHGTEDGLRRIFQFPFELGYFNLLAWQLLFFLGAYFGYRQGRGLGLRYTTGTVLAALMVVVFCFGLRHGIGALAEIPVGAATERASLAWLRLVDVLVLAYLLSGAFRLWPALGRVPALALLGRYSLQVYTFHVLLVYLLTPSFKTAVADFGWQAELPLYGLAIASLALPVWLYRGYAHARGHWRDARLLWLRG